MADLKTRVSHSLDAGPKSIPNEEREARRAALQAKLGDSVQMKGFLEPSHASEDLGQEMVTQDCVRYIETASCTTRDQEKLNIKTLPNWSKDENGYLRYEEGNASSSSADMSIDGSSSDLLIRFAYQRKAMVLAWANVADYSRIEKLHNLLALASAIPQLGVREFPLTRLRTLKENSGNSWPSSAGTMACAPTLTLRENSVL